MAVNKESEQDTAGTALELRIDQKVGLLAWNFDELNAQLDMQLKKYKGLQFAADDMTEAKKTRALLNHVAKEINDRKISVKREFCAPYTAFEDQAKKLIGKINDVSSDIDEQIKAYEENVQNAKLALMAEWWKENGDKNFSFDKVFEPRYLNATCSEKEWQADLRRKADKFAGEILVIMQMGDKDKVDFVLKDYLQTMDVGQSLTNWEDDQRRKAAAEERKAQIEAAAAAKRQQEQATANAPAEQQPESSTNQEPCSEDTYRIVFMVKGTRSQMVALADFMKIQGIQFWRQSGTKEEM